MRLILIVSILFSLDFHGSSGNFIPPASVALRNARWLAENRLISYQSYLPDVVKLLSQNISEEDDYTKPGFDPGDVPSIQEVHVKLLALCHKANVTFNSMNISRTCASDLAFLICSGTDFASATLQSLANHCEKQTTTRNVQNCLDLIKKQKDANKWTVDFVDSFGKSSAGWLSGNYMHLGSYQQCTQLNVKKGKSQSTFNGKFCYATFSVPLPATRARITSSCEGRNFSQECEPISNSYTVRWGFCVPKSCGIREANGLVYYAFHAAKLKFCPSKPLVMCVESPDLASDPAAVAMTTICAFLGLLVIAATTFDLIDRKILTREWLGCFGSKPETQNNSNHANSFELIQEPSNTENRKWYVTVLVSFSLYSNLKNLLDLNDRRRSETRCLDGIRVLTMAWIFLCQTHVLILEYLDNIVKYVKAPASLAFQAINNGSFATDTFFLLTGILLAYWWLKPALERDQKSKSILKNVAFVILRRLLRILPVYMFIVGLSTVFWSYLGEGPMWIPTLYSANGPFYCKFTWWSNLLFINNFLFLDYACMPWTWYIAVDMQIFILAIPILILYKKRPLAGFLVSIVLGILSMVLTGILVASYSLPPSLLETTNLSRVESLNEYYRKIFIKPYTRWNACLIGIFVGYFLRRTEKNKNAFGLKFLHFRAVNNLAWAGIIATCSVLIYSLHNYARGYWLSTIATVAYAVFSRTIWASMIGLLIILCLRTKSGLVKWFLSWNIWTPLSRLTYCAFLLHGGAILFFYGTAKETIHFSFGNMVYTWLSTLIISYGLGLIAYLGVEAPFTEIGRHFFSGRETEAVRTDDSIPAADNFKLLDQREINSNSQQ